MLGFFVAVVRAGRALASPEVALLLPGLLRLRPFPALPLSVSAAIEV